MPAYNATFAEVQAEAVAKGWEEDRDRYGRLIGWITHHPDGRASVPHKHIERQAPTPGCGCAPCRRPMCCDKFAEPVELSTGEVVNWICTVCFETPSGPTGDPVRAQLGFDPDILESELKR